jgi:hypothetical protein
MAKYANLRDRVSFPRVLDLPDYQIYDPEHYKHVSDQVIEPRRHWCLLAEIIKINKGFPLKLMARSLYNEEPFHIVFHTHDLGDSFVTPDLKLERTVAIMYARKHISRWKSIDVIVTDHYSIKVRTDYAGIPSSRFPPCDNVLKGTQLIPLSLHDLLRLNDQVQIWPRSFAKHKSCHSCGKKASQECQRCGILSYCSEVRTDTAAV